MKTTNYFWANSWINKYTLTGLAFVVWIGFFDTKYNGLKQYRLSKRLHSLELQKLDYSEKVNLARLEYEDLMKNQEKYAREKYFIGKKGEDVYIIESKKK